MPTHERMEDIDSKTEADLKEIGKACLRTGTKRISIDTNLLKHGSRKQIESCLDDLMIDMNNALNEMVPSPFFFDCLLRPREGGIPNEYEAYFRMSIVLHPFREWSFLMLRKIPILGNYIAGPKIISHLFLSKAQAKRMPNGE